MIEKRENTIIVNNVLLRRQNTIQITAETKIKTTHQQHISNPSANHHYLLPQ